MSDRVQWGAAYRFVGDGKVFPQGVEAGHPEAVRGTKLLRSADPNLTAVYNRNEGCFEIWGPSQDAGGWLPLVRCMDDHGRYFRPTVPWELIVGMIRQQHEDAERGIFAPDRAAERNRAMIASKEKAIRENTEEVAGYYADAFAQSVRGTLRHSPKDVALGAVLARDGKTKGAPVEQRTFAPGVQPKTGG